MERWEDGMGDGEMGVGGVEVGGMGMETGYYSICLRGGIFEPSVFSRGKMLKKFRKEIYAEHVSQRPSQVFIMKTDDVFQLRPSLNYLSPSCNPVTP